MLKRYHQTVGGAFRVVDGVVIILAWLASFGLRFYLPIIEVTKGFPSFSRYAALSPLILVLWQIVFSSQGVYGSTRMLRRTDEVKLVIRSHFVALLLFVALTYFFSEYRYSRVVLLYFGILSGLGMIAVRLSLRNTLRAIRLKGVGLRKVLVVGDGPSLGTLLARIQKFPELGLKPLGALTPEVGSGSVILPRLGGYTDLRSQVQKLRPDQVLFVLSRSQSSELDPMLETIRDETVDIVIVPDLFDYMTLGCGVEDFDGVPIVRINDSPLEGWGSVAKRLTDLVLSAVGLLVLSPLLGIIALLIKFTSRGPILYAQERMGLDGRTFEMLKFRSMHVGAEEKTGAVWASAEDQRRTPIGSFLRRTSLDELPQLWNVLKGDMSLVGPRPERPVFVDQFRGQIPHYMLRHKVKAGVTGWAQVNGWRGNTSLEARIQCDLYYIRNWSYLLDLKIILLTFFKGFIHKNAY